MNIREWCKVLYPIIKKNAQMQMKNKEINFKKNQSGCNYAINHLHKNEVW